MANGIDLATAYVSIVGETKRLDDDIKRAFKGADRHAAAAGTSAGRVMGKNAADKMSATLQSELRGEKIGTAVGTVIGKGIGGAISLAIKGAALGATAAVGGIGVTLFKGFERYKSLDATAKRLGNMGKTGNQVKTIMGDLTKVVEGTPIALNEAAESAIKFLTGGVKEGAELNKVMTAIADSAGASGQNFSELATVFGQVMNKGKLQAEEMNQLNERGINIQALLRDEFHLTGDQLTKMSEEGAISFDMLLQAVEGKFGGMAKAAGNSIDGAISNMQTAVAKVGANFLSAIFGDPLDTTKGPGGMAAAINNVTAKLNDVNAWVVSHQGEIKQFFTDAANTAKDVAGAVKDIGVFLAQHKEIIIATAGIWAGWKAISATATVLTTLKSISSLLAVTLPASAATGAAGISSALAGITIPATLGGLLAGTAGTSLLNQGKDVQPLTGDVGGSGLNPLSGDQSVTGIQPNAQRQRRGFAPVDPTGGLLGGTTGLQPLASGLKQRYAGMGFAGIGGYSGTVDQPWDEHQTGNAIDVPVGMGPGSVSKGNAILADALAQRGVHHVIWQGKTYYPDGRVEPMSDRGSPTENHMDHVHINARATGGPISGPGGSKSDSIPAWLSNGEHVLTAKDVAAMGGQGGVYAFRNMLHRSGGGSIATGAIIWPPEPPGPKDKVPGGVPNRKPGRHKGTIGLPHWDPGVTWGPPPDDWWLRPVNPDDILFPELLPPGSPWRDPHGKWRHPHDKRRIRGFAEGGAVGDEQVKKWLEQGVPEQQLIAQLGATPEQIQRVATQRQGAAGAVRTEGYMPAAAGNTGKTGGGLAGSLLNIGAEAINGLIDQAVQAASQAASMASMAGSFGTDAGMGGAAASIAIKMGGEAAKRGVKYAAELGGIGVGALTEILSPFGAPRWLTDVDASAFMPNWQPTEAALTTAEQATKTTAQEDPNLAGFPNAEPHGAGQGALPGPQPNIEALDVISNAITPPDNVNPAAQPPMFHVDNIYAQDSKGVADELNKRGRLNMMQYAGRP